MNQFVLPILKAKCFYCKSKAHWSQRLFIDGWGIASGLCFPVQAE